MHTSWSGVFPFLRLGSTAAPRLSNVRMHLAWPHFAASPMAERPSPPDVWSICPFVNFEQRYRRHASWPKRPVINSMLMW